MTGKNSVKHHYYLKKISTVAWKILLMQITDTQKGWEDFMIKILSKYHNIFETI